MREGLSFEGLLLQARDVLRGRWKLLLAVAVGWVLALWAADRLKYAILGGADVYAGDPMVWVLGMITAVPFVIGSAVMTGAVVRTGHGRRAPAEALKHWALAAATVLLAVGVTQLDRPILVGLARLSGPTEAVPPVLALAGLIKGVAGLLLFAFFGMTTPAALERPVPPWTAAAVALKLSQGRRGWLFLIGIVWGVVMVAPLLLITVARLEITWFAAGLTVFAQILSAIGLGVLYLELRRLHGAIRPEATAETFD